MASSQPLSRSIQPFSRRRFVVGGSIAGVSTALALSTAFPSQAETGDLAILNAAIDLENQGIWAYGVAGGKLSHTEVGRTILALAQRNRADHVKHRDALIQAVRHLGGTPAPAKASYDLSSYLQAGEGNLDSDANIGKLALALEVDAVLAYNAAFSQLSDRNLLVAAATIGPVEACHATAIRAVFRSLIPTLEFVPASFISAETRHEWVLTV